MSWSTFFLVSSSRAPGLSSDVATRSSLHFGKTSLSLCSHRLSRSGHRPSFPDLTGIVVIVTIKIKITQNKNKQEQNTLVNKTKLE